MYARQQYVHQQPPIHVYWQQHQQQQVQECYLFMDDVLARARKKLAWAKTFLLAPFVENLMNSDFETGLPDFDRAEASDF